MDAVQHISHISIASGRERNEAVQGKAYAKGEKEERNDRMELI